MILFDLMINFIESFMFSYFLGNYFHLRRKHLYLTIITFIQTLFLMQAKLHILNDTLISVDVILIMTLSLILWVRKVRFDYIYIVLMYNCFIIMSAICGIFIASAISNILSITDISKIYILKCLMSKLIQIVITCLVINKKINFSTTLDIKNWSMVIIFDLALLFLLTLSAYSIITGKGYSNIMVWIFILSFCSSVLYRYIIHKIDELNKQRIEYARMEELSKYNSEKLTMIKHITEEISKNDHRIFYMLLQMEGYLENKEYDKLKTVIQGYRNLVTKYKLVTNTQNPVFDSLYSMKINDLILKEKNIKNSIFISRRIEYDHLPLIDFITGVLDFFNDCQTIMISMDEVGDTLVVRVIYREGIIDEKRVRNYLENKLPKGNVSLENHATKGVRFSIDLGDFNEV